MFARKGLVALLAVMVAILGAVVNAQEFRGSVRGTVTDSTGAVLPGVTVTVTNIETKIAQTAVTDGEGRYQLLYLNPGTYSVTAELSGFKKFALEQRVGVADALRVDAVLQTGGIEETVQVKAESTLLNTSSGISGTTVDAKQIAELPLGDGTAYMLTRLAPGIMDTSDLHFSRPADNGNLGGVVANGAQGGNEFTIDGAPNMSNAKGVGFSPPSGAISEFKVQTSAFDAQSGHTAGAVVNLALKNGTNSFRGEAAYFNRDDKRSSTPLLTERQNGTKPTREYNRGTGTLSGPIVRNKTFFMGSFERLRDVQPEPATYTVPTELMRAGKLHRVRDPGVRPGHRDLCRRPESVPRQHHRPESYQSHLGCLCGVVSAAQPAGLVEQLLHQPAAPLRLQRRDGTRRPQLQLGEPPLYHRVLEQARGGSLQLGAGRRECYRRTASSTASR